MTDNIKHRLKELTREIDALALMMLEAGDNATNGHGFTLQVYSRVMRTWIKQAKENEPCPKCNDTGIYVRHGVEHECGCNRSGART